MPRKPVNKVAKAEEAVVKAPAPAKKAAPKAKKADAAPKAAPAVAEEVVVEQQPQREIKILYLASECQPFCATGSGFFAPHCGQKFPATSAPHAHFHVFCG